MAGSSYITVVTGLPRSGSTMMMRMLEAGGIEPYYDNSRPLNGVGFINYNIILRETVRVGDFVKGNGHWMNECYGKAVKVLTPARVQPPKGHKYRFIYMDRKVKQILKSLKKYLRRCNQPTDPRRYLTTLEQLRMAREKSLALLKTYADSATMVLRFEEALRKPLACCLRVRSFLGQDLDVDRMAGVVIKRPVQALPFMLEEHIYV